MKTDDLIDLLAQDAPVRLRLDRAVLGALVFGGLISAGIFAATIGLRPELLDALQTSRVILKIAVTVTLAATASCLVLQIGKPGVPLRPYFTRLLIPLGLLMFGIIAELYVLPRDQWQINIMGRYADYCLVYIPLLSLAPLVLLFLALKGGAPETPGFAGAAAGLTAGGIGASIYAWHCPDDSPLFVAVWYMIAIAAATLCGYLVGRRLLRW